MTATVSLTRQRQAVELALKHAGERQSGGVMNVTDAISKAETRKKIELATMTDWLRSLIIRRWSCGVDTAQIARELSMHEATIFAIVDSRPRKRSAPLLTVEA